MAQVLGYALQFAGASIGFTPLGVALYVAGVSISVADQADKTRKARHRARDQANANLKDRLEMVDLQPDAPRTLPLGRVRTVEGIRRRWVSGTNSEKLTMVVSFAGCEIDAFEQFYFNDTAVSLDGSGWVTTVPYLKGNLFSQRATFVASSSTQTVTLAHEPVAGSVTAGWDATTTGGWDSPDYVPGGTATVSSVSGASVTLTGLLVNANCYVAYQTTSGASTARIRTWTGAAGQNVGAAIAAEYPGKITSADKFAGMAVAVIDILYDPDVYPQGRPNITAVLRGAKVYDPRKDSSTIGTGSHRIGTPATWEWSENPALCALRYATWSSGFALPAAELAMADIAAAANACAVSTDFVTRIGAGPTSTVTLPRYRCGIVISSAGDPRSGMAGILESMAGRSGWAGGVWRLRAGTKAAPAFTMVPEWLARPLGGDGQPADEPVVTMSNGVAREQKINRVTGSCVDPDQRWQTLPFPAVQDAVLIAAEGEYATEVEFEGVTHIAHAQHLASITIRENQAALRISARCNMHAYRCELFDVGTLQLPRYGMTAELAKTAEVIGWRWHPTEGVSLQLAEISDAIYAPVDELVGRDPAPNSTLPALTDVETLVITAITSNTDTLSDGSITTRTSVQWNPAVSEAVRSSGQIEVQYAELASGALPADWSSWIEGGSSTFAIIPALRAGRLYLFRVRALKPSVGVRGPWSLHAGHLISNTPPVRWGQVLGRPTTFRAMSRGFSDVNAPFAGAPYFFGGLANGETGENIHENIAESGYWMVTKISRATKAVSFVGRYYPSSGGASMAAELNAIGSDHFVVVTTCDEPSTGRDVGGLDAAMYRCGASRAVYGSSQFQYRSAYIMVGIGGCGEGNGFEAYNGAVGSDTNAWCDVTFQVTANGGLVISGTSYTPKTLRDYSYTGDYDATRGAPLGTAVGYSEAGIVSTATANYNTQVRDVYVGGDRGTFYPVLLVSTGAGPAAYFDVVVHRPDVHVDGLWTGSYTCHIWARGGAFGSAPPAVIEIDQITGAGTYTYGVGDVITNLGTQNAILLYLRGGLTHRISVSQPIGPYSVDVYLGGYSDPYGMFNPTTSAPLSAYLNKAYCPSAPVDWGVSVGGAGKPENNATYGATFGANITGTASTSDIGIDQITTVSSAKLIGTLPSLSLTDTLIVSLSIDPASRPLLILATGYFYGGYSCTQIIISIKLDGSVISQITLNGSGLFWEFPSISLQGYIASPSAGSHTVSLEFNSNGGGAYPGWCDKADLRAEGIKR